MERNAYLFWLANRAPLLLFAAVLLAFGLLSPQFRALENFLNIVIQSSSTAIVAVGMTFVLLTAGVDLSVGAIMFVGAAVAGKLMLGGSSMVLAIGAMLLASAAGGALNAACVTWLRVVPFVVTLASLYFYRGLALSITETRAMNLPSEFLALGSARIVGIPGPVLILALVVILADIILRRTAFGRQIYAVGHDIRAARRAGINTERILFSVYVISGICAGLGGVVALAQLAAVSPTFGQQKEFQAIAAAVLGGTSLFGGRGQVLPGTVMGAFLIQTVENGLNILNANPYVYPVITSAVIFFAVFVDSIRHKQLQKLSRRAIRHPASWADPGLALRVSKAGRRVKRDCVSAEIAQCCRVYVKNTRTILDDIMVDVRRELAEAQAQRPLSELKAAIADAVPVRSFKAALQSGFGLIAEIKDRSPSHGAMRRENVDRAAVAYEQSPIVRATSVLTNAAHFGMSMDRLRQVKLAMTKPVLRKDFIFDDYQVYEARAFGADAILLMANLLDGAEMKRLYQLARALGMSALFECHNLEQIRQVPVDAEIYGINSRTFDSSAARYSVSTLMGKLGAKRDFTIESERFELGRHLPAAAIKVAESGVTPATVARLRDQLHYDAALVGTSLLTAGRGIEAELCAFEAALNAQGTASCDSTTSTAKNV